jgi:hypothetical protein
MTEAGFARRLRSVAEELQHQATYRVPQAKKSKNLAERFRKHGEQYLQFITTPEIDPTNNLAEQAIRFVVVDRKITQGSRSESGQKWLERIWTVTATCAQTGHAVFDLLNRCRDCQLPRPTSTFIGLRQYVIVRTGRRAQ